MFVLCIQKLQIFEIVFQHDLRTI